MTDVSVLARLAGRRGPVAVVGDVMTDILVRPLGPPAPGADRRAAIRMLPGGSAANQAAWLAHHGVAVRLAARVGADDRPALAAALRAAGIEPLLAGDPSRPTGALVALLDPDGQRSFLTDRGANDGLCAADLPDALLQEAALLHVSAYALVEAGPRAAVLDLMARAAARAVPASLDPGSASFLREIGPDAFLAATAGAALCFANADEAAVLARSADPCRQRAVLAGHYGLAVIKRGAEGAELAAPDGSAAVVVPAAAAAVLDTTGAGDAFTAAFLAAARRGVTAAACLAAGVEGGTAAVTVLGGRPPGAGPRPPVSIVRRSG